LAEEILSGSYRPLPVLRIRPAFLAASERALVVPTVRDRVVQRAIADLLVPAIDPTLSPACRAFRKGSSARAAAEDVGRWIEQGEAWVLRADVKGFFDAIQPEILRAKLELFVDEEGLRFLDRIVRCRIFDHDQVSETITGIAQGSPLSPLLGNLYLSDLDAAIEKAHVRYIRYCDDLLVLGPREDEVRRARQEIAAQLEPLGLTLNEEKTRVCRAEDGFVFLGYLFGPTGRGPAVKAVEALRFRLAEITAAEEPAVAEVDALFRGWTAYFGDHPECWTGSPTGLLALLRNPSQPGSGDAVRRLTDARWKLPSPVSPRLGFLLAEAWMARGHPEQSWSELAASCGGSRSDLVDEESWGRLLRVDPRDLVSLARRLVGTPADRLTILSEAVAELGRYDIASRLAAAGAAAATDTESETATPAGAELVTDADLRLLAEWFQGREGVHAQKRWTAPATAHSYPSSGRSCLRTGEPTCKESGRSRCLWCARGIARSWAFWMWTWNVACWTSGRVRSKLSSGALWGRLSDCAWRSGVAAVRRFSSRAARRDTTCGCGWRNLFPATSSGAGCWRWCRPPLHFPRECGWRSSQIAIGFAPATSVP
jgi:group II intron reverse transcriptase/maturase